MSAKKHILFAIAVSTAIVCGNAAGPYFVDGYHGGIYGHYPVEDYTQFMVDQLNAHPQWRIGLEIEPETWDTVAVRTPEAYARFAEMMANSGRLEYTNPSYAQPYCYNISGESIIRQFQYGMTKLREHFPEITFETYAVEEPCFTSCLPQILTQLGFKYATLKCPNTCWGGYAAPFGGELVNWIGSDGSSILTSPRHACEDLEENSVWQTTSWGNTPGYLQACRDAGIENIVGMTYQDAGWRHGPWLKKHNPSTYVLWREYFKDCTAGKTTEDYHLTQDDIRPNLMWGSQVMQRIGRQVHRAENAMVTAEKVAAIALLDDIAYRPDQKAIDEGWRQLMLAQHHDSWIVPYNGLKGYGTWANAIRLWTNHACMVADNEICRATAATDSKDTMTVKVLNTTARPCKGIVEIAAPKNMDDGTRVMVTGDIDCRIGYVTGQKLIFNAEAPAMGYAVYKISALKSSDDTKTRNADSQKVNNNDGDITLSNEFFALTISPSKGGIITSMLNVDGEEIVAPGSDFGAMKGYFYNERCEHSSVDSPARITAMSITPLRQTLTIEGHIGKHPYTQTYTVEAGNPAAKVDLVISWHGNPGIGEYRERHWNRDRRAFCDDAYKLHLSLPTAFSAKALWKDAPYDICRSTNDNTRFSHWSEIKNNVILNWVYATSDNADEATPGLGIITDHTTSYLHSPEENLYGLTLQYSGQGLWGRNYEITGPTELTYALVPGKSGAKAADAMCEATRRFNEPLMAVIVDDANEPASRSLLQTNHDGYAVTATMTANDMLSVRIFNENAPKGLPCRLSVNLPVHSATLTDLDSNVIANLPLQSNETNAEATDVELQIPPMGIRTVTFALKQNLETNQQLTFLH